jgi:hypothetical protein
MPLPAGRVRVNQASADGALEFIGEDLIKHTPRNETLVIRLGNAFDVVGERKQVAFAYDAGARKITETIEVSVRNRKLVPAKVVVREYLFRWSDWKIASHSQPFVKHDAATIDFDLQLAADAEGKVRYVVEYTW